MHSAAIMTATFLGLAPGMASACVIDVTQCDTDGGIAYLHDHVGSVVLFNEARFDTETSRSLLVECTSRQGVMVEDAPDDYARLRDAEDYFRDVMFDAAPQGLDQIARRLRQRGIDAVRVQLPAGHCGCDLPAMPPPDNHCPDF